MSTAPIHYVSLDEILNKMNLFIHPNKTIKRKLKKWEINTQR